MIQEYKLGAFIIEGKQFIGSIKIVDKKVRYWERENLVLDVKDIEELLRIQPEFIVIGTGAGGLLKVPDSVKQAISSKGISMITAKTQDAIKKFNELFKDKKKVAGIFNSGS